MSDKPRIIDAIAAVAIVLEKYEHLKRREILGAVEVNATDPSDWCVVVAARTHEDEWRVYQVWPDGEDPKADEFDHVAGGMVVREHSNALSYGDATLQMFGLGVGFLES